MKSLIPWFCLAASTGSQLSFASDGLQTYREGNYFAAGQELLVVPHKDAVSNDYLANMTLYGYGILKNNTQAIHYYKQAAEKGSLSAQRTLALYALLKEKKPEEALYWFKKAADAHDKQAQMYTAAAYLFGFGAKKNPDIAKRYYIEAARNGDGIAQCTLAKDFLANRQMSSRNLGMIWLNKAVDAHDPEAQMILGEMYNTGSMVTKDVAKAKELVNQSIAQGYVPALYQMGVFMEQEQNLKQAKTWYDKGALAHDSKAEMALAKLYLQEKGPFYDPHLGFLWMLKAAQAGLQAAQLEVASMYQNGRNVEKDEAVAKEWQQKAALGLKSTTVSPEVEVARWLSKGRADDIASCGYRLQGIFNDWQNAEALKQNNYNPFPFMEKTTRDALYKPQFVMTNPNDIPISDYYDVIASVLNNSPLQADNTFPHYALDKSSLQQTKGKFGSYIPTQMMSPHQESESDSDANQPIGDDAVTYLKARAVLGDPSAQFTLGQLYQKGVGVAKNTQDAIKNYELASAQQDLRAEYNLGLIYLEGDGVTPDYDKATQLLKDAAFKGNEYAQYVLARIAELGYRNTSSDIVLKPDHEQAIAMYDLAAANDYGLAQYRLAELLVRDKPADLSVGTKMARQNLIKRLYQSALAHGIKPAALPLAFFNAMDKDAQKQAQALAVAKEDANKGYPGACLLLGLMYDRGIALKADRDEAISWYEKASQNPVTSFILGTYYSQGIGVSKNEEKGKSLLQQSAEAGLPYAHFNLAILNHEQGTPFIPQLDQALAMGNSKAGLLLADYYLSNATDTDGMQKARAIYQRFAEEGDKEGQVKLGFMLEQGLGGSIDRASAKKWYTQSAEQGQPVAQYLLGRLYQLGDEAQSVDYAQAKEWYQRAEKHYAPAAVALGFIYDTVDADYQRALKNYQIAVQNNLAVGQYDLGLIYEFGKGRPVDFSTALTLYESAAKQGLAPAMVQLAGLYYRGQGVSQDDDEALSWYKKAAVLGDDGALFQLALWTETGIGGVQSNVQEAIRLYKEAAAKGNVKAKLALARVYQQGAQGIAVDKELAHQYYKELAELGNAFAQYQLAMFYYEPEENKQMISAEGKMWLVRARDNGSQEASRMLQWLDAKTQERTSFIEPVSIHASPDMAQR